MDQDESGNVTMDSLVGPPLETVVMPDDPSEITLLLQQAKAGDADAGSLLFQLVQQELHQMAEQKLTQENPGATIQATVLVDDAFLQLMGAAEQVEWNDRKHFYVLAAKAMRRILIDRARNRRALKRGGKDWKRVDVSVEKVPGRVGEVDILELHEALKQLAELDSRQAEIVELRHFGGYSVEETADLLGVSPSTVKQEFASAKAWLFRELSRE